MPLLRPIIDATGGRGNWMYRKIIKQMYISNMFSLQRKQQNQQQISLTAVNSATLTPMHLRKAKLMFFWVRYPSSSVLKMYFPDIKFNKNNTAQLVKWFSNFR